MRALIFSLFAVAAYAQNAAVFPGRVATNSDLYIATNNFRTTLLVGINATATSATVTSATGMVAPGTVTIDNEIMAVCQVSGGNTLTFGKSSCPNVDGRGIDGAVAVSHLSTAAVQGRVVATLHNQVAAEITSIETRALRVAYVTDYGAKGDDSTDDTTAIQNTLTALGNAGGGTAYMPAFATYKISSTLTVPANVHLAGFGASATTLNQTGAANAVNLTGSFASAENFSVTSAGGGITMGPSVQIEQPYVQNVYVLSVGNGNSCFSTTPNNTGGFILTPTWINNRCNGGSAAPSVGTRIGYDFSAGSGSAGPIGGVIIGGRVTNVFRGIYHASHGDTLQVYGTMLDGITNGNAQTGCPAACTGGKAIETNADGDVFNVRLEDASSVDVDLQLDSGAYMTRFYSTDISGSLAAQIVDNSGFPTTHTICCFDGGTYINRVGAPQQFMGNVSINSGRTFSMPGQVSNQLQNGGTLSSTQMEGIPTIAVDVAPNNSYAHAFGCDQAGRCIYATTQDNNGTTTGTSFSLSLPPGSNQIPAIYWGANGGSAAPKYFTSNAPIHVAPLSFANLPTCNGSSAGTMVGISDSNVSTFGATITAGGGGSLGIAYCNGSNWTYR